MPVDAAKQIYDQLGAEGSSFMVPAAESDVSNLAVIHALRTAADGMKRLGEQQDRLSHKIDRVGDGIHDIDKRLSIIESNSVGLTVKDHEERLSALEEDKQRRAGAVGLFEWVSKSWPAIVAFVTLVVYVVLNESGRL